MKRTISQTLLAAVLAVALPAAAAPATLLGWNNLGMHCDDSDFSVFSILPPYNTLEAQLIVNGLLVTNGGGYTVSYEGVADPNGSINTTSAGKVNFWTYTLDLYGPLAPDVGLLGWAMPGTNNLPQAMLFETTNRPAAGVATPVNWWRAEGIPITPYDDAGRRNEYPLLRLVARDAANNVVATSDVVAPISDEMACSVCHASSGGSPAAQPAAGWVNDPNGQRDYRLNILRLHDDRQFAAHAAEYTNALAARGFNAAGLYANVVSDGRPILCAACHLSEALPGSGLGSLPPLTRAIHSLHATVTDPVLHLTLDNADNRQACYRCHPGATTQCLRGAMGSAIASDGSQAMQCQSCHGNLSQVGAATRVGWFQEPACQSCHTGTATHNNGQIRYTSVFTDTNYTVRAAVDNTFATSPNTPAAGLSLYRFSVGHGGLQCEGCHGSTHAEFASTEPNDNILSTEVQGHVGVIAECTACHATAPSTVNGGPHGMHPLGQSWVSQHGDAADGNAAACQACHGADDRGTVLSLVQADRTLSAFGTQSFFRGAIIGCYTCHNGPGGDSANTSVAPTVGDVTTSTAAGQPVALVLPAAGGNLTLRIISQPVSGSVGLSNNVATYFPPAGFSGTATFTFAAYDGSKNSQLATATVIVGGSGGGSGGGGGGGSGAIAPTITAQPASQTVTAGATVTLSVSATGTAPLSYQWQQNGVDMAGATAATLTLNNVTSAAAGAYRVSVRNSAGTVTSATANLTVATPSFSVVLVSPNNGAVYTAPASVDLVASVAPAGSAARVQFFDGESLLGVVRTPPFTLTAWDLGSGQHTFTARATSAAGVTVTSPPVSVTVRSPADGLAVTSTGERTRVRTRVDR